MAAWQITHPETQVPRPERQRMDASWLQDRTTCKRIAVDSFFFPAHGILLTVFPRMEWAMGGLVYTELSREKIGVRPLGGEALSHTRVRRQASVASRDWSGLFSLTDL